MFSFFYVAISRAAYPFQIEWIEASLYLNVMRILQGKPIYGPPSVEFVPALYTPFYYYASSLFALVTENIMFSMRIVSIIATVIMAISIYGICHRLGWNFLENFIAVGVFFASYKVAGFYYDLGRVDNLALSLSALSSWLALRQKNRLSYGILIGFILGLAFFTKQHALLSAGFLLIYLGIRKEWKTAFGLAGALIVLIAGYYFVSYLTTGFWTFFYTVTVPGSSPILKRMLLVFLRDILIPTYWPLLLIILASIVILFVRRDWRLYSGQIIAMACVMTPLAIFGVGTYIKIWGYINGFGGVAAAIGIITAFCVHQLLKSSSSFLKTPVLKYSSFGLIFLLIVWQFWMLRYNPRSQIPREQDAQAGFQLLQEIKQLPQPVFIPTAAYMLDLVGLPTNYHVSQYSDISLGAKYNSSVKSVYEQYGSEVTDPWQNGYFQAYVSPNTKYFDDYFSDDKGYQCKDFPEVVLKSIDGAGTFLRGICVKPNRNNP